MPRQWRRARSSADPSWPLLSGDCGWEEAEPVASPGGEQAPEVFRLATAAADGLLPPGPIEEQVPRLARLFSRETASRSSVASLLAPAALADLRSRLPPREGPRRTPRVIAFLAHHGLARCIEDPVATLDALDALALRAWQRCHGETVAPEVDWEAIEGLLLAALDAAPPADASLQERVMLAFGEAISEGSGELQDRVLRAPWHEGWAPLALWLASRTDLPSDRPLTDGDRLRLAAGSTLAQECLRAGQRRLLAWTELLSEGTHNGSDDARAQALLAQGGGTLQTLDYPSFRVVCRQVIDGTNAGRNARLQAIIAEDLRPIAVLLESGHQRYLEAPREGLAHPIGGLISQIRPAVWGALAPGERLGVERALHRSTAAFLGLRARGVTGRVRRQQLVGFWSSPEAPDTLAVLRAARHLPRTRLIEALVMAMVTELHQPHAADRARQAALKELLIETLRTLAACYCWDWMMVQEAKPPEFVLQTIKELEDLFDEGPRELVAALGLDPQQGLPRLRGGSDRSLEATFRRLYRQCLLGPRRGETTVHECRVISHEEALRRGDLGRDCCNWNLPLRALSPHHVYYGIFDEKGVQQPGYLTVYEAWGTTEGGEPGPVLCLETINEPRNLLGGAMQDLLVIFEAIAHSRGLGPGLAFVNDMTWSYPNVDEVTTSRSFAEGHPIWLSPADPVVWRVYSALCPESVYYSHAFETPRFEPAGPICHGRLLRGGVRESWAATRLLAPFDLTRDRVQPENLEEARRLWALPPRPLRVTCRDARGPVGFISG